MTTTEPNLPDQIKALIARLRNYTDTVDDIALMEAAALALEQQSAEIERLKREREAQAEIIARLRAEAGRLAQSNVDRIARIEAARKILEPLADCDPDVREWLGMERWGEKA